MSEQNQNDSKIPTVDIRKYEFSPPGPMGWSFQEYEKLLENPDYFLNEQSQFSKLLDSIEDTELIELPSNAKPIKVQETFSQDRTPSENHVPSPIEQKEKESDISINQSLLNKERLNNEQQEKTELNQLVIEKNEKQILNKEDKKEKNEEKILNKEVKKEKSNKQIVNKEDNKEKNEKLIPNKEIKKEKSNNQIVNKEGTKKEKEKKQGLNQEVTSKDQDYQHITNQEDKKVNDLNNLKKYINDEEVDLEKVKKEISDIIILGINEKLKRKKQKGNNILFYKRKKS